MRLVYSVLTVVTLICIYTIVYVGLGYGWPIGASENYERINTVMLNLSYSYMAGLIFYLFTSTLPHLVRSKKYEPIIREKEANIYGRLIECAKAAYSPSDDDIAYDKDMIVAKYESHRMSEPCFYQIYSLNKLLQLQRSNITDAINGLLVYADYIQPDELEMLEQIKDSQFFSQISVFQWTEMDTAEQRKKTGEYLFDLIQLTSKFKQSKKQFYAKIQQRGCG